MNTQDQMPRSPSSRVRVNGGRIRFIRESKGLTQLYVATALGVTTDTVSRWENGKYPTVKWENVEKLATALDVEVSELLEEEEGAAEEPTVEVVDKKAGPDKRLFLAFGLMAAAIIAAFFFVSLPKQEVAHIGATRFLPMHITPGQPFPVVVQVASNGNQPFSFILEEMLPDNFTVVRSLPEIASVDAKSNTVKWIGNSRQSPFFLAYLVETHMDLHVSGKIVFAGRIKANDAPRFGQNILGDSELVVTNHHWVDANGDGVIDDEEILTAFGSADVLRELGVDLEEIKKIWSVGSYRWDNEAEEYQIIQKREVVE